jgi:type I restriction enzyme M protein
MTRLTAELADLFERSHALEDEIKKRLMAIGYELR